MPDPAWQLGMRVLQPVTMAASCSLDACTRHQRMRMSPVFLANAKLRLAAGEHGDEANGRDSKFLTNSRSTLVAGDQGAKASDSGSKFLADSLHHIAPEKSTVSLHGTMRCKYYQSPGKAHAKVQKNIVHGHFAPVHGQILAGKDQGAQSQRH